MELGMEREPAEEGPAAWLRASRGSLREARSV